MRQRSAVIIQEYSFATTHEPWKIWVALKILEFLKYPTVSLYAVPLLKSKETKEYLSKSKCIANSLQWQDVAGFPDLKRKRAREAGSEAIGPSLCKFVEAYYWRSVVPNAVVVALPHRRSRIGVIIFVVWRNAIKINSWWTWSRSNRTHLT